MHPLVAAKRAEIEALCRRYKVSRLELFGSATGPAFDPTAATWISSSPSPSLVPTTVSTLTSGSWSLYKRCSTAL